MDSGTADGGLDRHWWPGLGQQRHQDTAVLAVVGCVVLQRDCGDRHPGEGLTDLPGLLPVTGVAAAALAAAAGYVSMLSLATCWDASAGSSLSDKIGRKNAYRMYLRVGALLYLTITLMQKSNKVVFLICTLLILSFYGAGFATVPAYLRDLFGTYQGAIHGRLLTAGRWHPRADHDRASAGRVRVQRASQTR
jgi:hypothetical protein